MHCYKQVMKVRNYENGCGFFSKSELANVQQSCHVHPQTLGGGKHMKLV